MSERPCLMIDISQSDWDKISKLSEKYKIVSLNGNTKNAAGFIRVMLYMLIRNKRIKCMFDEDIPEALKQKVAAFGIENIPMSNVTRKCDDHRQVRATEDFRRATNELSEKLKIPYGGIVRSIIEFSLKNL